MDKFDVNAESSALIYKMQEALDEWGYTTGATPAESFGKATSVAIACVNISAKIAVDTKMPRDNFLKFAGSMYDEAQKLKQEGGG